MVVISAQPHEAVFLDGSKIDWDDPPRATTKVMWSKRTTSGKKITGSFRTICWLNRLNNLAYDKWDHGIEVIQPPYNVGVVASAGTHDLDACVDLYIPGVSWWAMQRFVRANGGGGWYRHPPLFGNHIHVFCLPPQEGQLRADDWAVAGFRVGKYVDGGYSTSGRQITSAQITDYYNHAFGLSGQHTPNSDHSWFPASIKDTIFDLKTYVAKRAKKQPPPPPPPVSKERLMADWSFYDDAMPAIDVPQIVGVARYFSGNPAKDISDAERRKHHADGKWVLPVFETSANRARAGAAAGREDRLAAEAQADDLGWPVEDTVFMAVDFDATWAQVVDYFNGVNAVKRRPVGVYGSGLIVDRSIEAGLASDGWESASRSWGHGYGRSQHASLLQRTTKSVHIKGVSDEQWDENLVIPGRKIIPVWNPGEPAWKKPPPPPPPVKKPTSTHLRLVGEPEVRPHETSDHNPVLWKLEMDSGKTYQRAQWNVQGTDEFGQVQRLIREILDIASIVVLNEVTTLRLQNFMHQLRQSGVYNCYLPGVQLSPDGKQVVKEHPASAVVVAWRRGIWTWKQARSTRICKGARGFSPHRYVNRVLFQHDETQERHRDAGTHWVHAIDTGGRARTITLPGQIGRGEDCSANMVAALEADSIERVDGMTYPTFLSGDLNVDFESDRAHFIKGDATPWFPYSALHPIAHIDKINTHPPTHGSRNIDWGAHVPAK
jgi:hypothetical protein